MVSVCGRAAVIKPSGKIGQNTMTQCIAMIASTMNGIYAQNFLQRIITLQWPCYHTCPVFVISALNRSPLILPCRQPHYSINCCWMMDHQIISLTLSFPLSTIDMDSFSVPWRAILILTLLDGVSEMYTSTSLMASHLL